MLDATFACPDLTTFCRSDELGLEVTGQRLEPDWAVLACRVVGADPKGALVLQWLAGDLLTPVGS
jgi:hypothetical protein